MIRFQPYRRKRSYALAIVIILLALFISWSGFHNLSGIRSFFQAVIYPFQFATVFVWKGVTGIPGSIANLRHLSEENADLKRRIDNVRPKLLALGEIKKENKRLKAALEFKQNNPHFYNLLVAQVVGRAPSPWFSILEINQGSLSKVKKGMPVIAQKGIVGQVIEVSRYSAKVMLLTNPESTIAAVDARSRDMGVVAGTSSNRVFMKYVGTGEDIRTGDQVVTAQISTVYPPGLPIGQVIHASKREHDLFYRIEIKPAVDFSKIEEVFVIL